MKIAITLILILSVTTLYAQYDSSAHPKKMKTVSGTLRQKLSMLSGNAKHDTTKLKIPTRKDSTQTNGVSKYDTLNRSALLKIDSAKVGANHTLDSLQQFNPVNNFTDKIDSVGERISGVGSKVEQKILQPQQLIQSKLDSVTQTIHKPVDKVNEKVSDVNTKIGGAIDKKEQAIQQKLSSAESDIPQIEGLHGKEALPQVNPKVEGLSIDDKIPGVSTDALNTSKVGVDIPVADINALTMESPLQDVDVSNDLSLPDTSTPKLGDLEELKNQYNPTEQLQTADAKLGEVEELETGVQQLKEGDTHALEKRAEAQVTQVEDVKGLSQGINEATAEQAKYAAAIKKYKDKKLLSEEVKRKALNVVHERVNHLSPAFLEAQADISKLKKKYSEVTSINDLPKHKPNPMRGKPFKERFIPGGSFQLYNQELLSMDVDLHASWRFTKKLSGSLAAVYRVGMSDQYEYLVKGLNIYGGRAYVDWVYKKGFYLHGEGEMLRVGKVQLTSSSLSVSSEYDDHLISAVAGIGRQFNISRRIQGSILGLYRFELDGYIPGYKKLNMRIGINYLLWKRKQKMPAGMADHFELPRTSPIK